MSTSMKFLTLPRIHFSGANAQPAWWCVGAPGPLAHCGFGHAMARAMGAVDEFKGVAVVHHDWELLAEDLPNSNTIHPHQFRAASFVGKKDYVGSSKSLSGQPTVRGRGVVSLILAFDADAAIDVEQVTDFLRRARIAGGTISSHGYDEKHGNIYTSMEDASKRIKSGFSFVNRCDLIAVDSAPEDGDSLDRFLAITRRKKGQTSSESWLMPYMAGYRALTPIEARSFSRDGYPHAFAEPLVGLGQFVSLRNGVPPLWSHKQIDEMTFIVDSEIPVQDLKQEEGDEQSTEESPH
jgi:CRISPR-associated protein Csy2